MSERYYECEICGHNHPWDWDGECRDDKTRFTNEQLDKMHGENGYQLYTMDERVRADQGDYEDDFEQECYHIAIVSISETECQCMDCLRVWDKEPDFKSDWPNRDRG